MEKSLITHLYSISNGIYLAVSVMLFLGAISYVREKSINGLSNVCAVLFCIVFGFWFYSIFWHHFHSPETMPYYPSWIYKPSIYISLFACAISTFSYIRVFGYKWVKRYTYSRQIAFFEALLYAIYLASAIYLSGDLSVYHTFMVLLANFLIFCLFALGVTLICGDHKIGKIYAIFFIVLTSYFFVLGYFSYTKEIIEHPWMAISHVLVSCSVLYFCFASFRYGFKELTDFFNLQALDNYNVVRDLPKAISKEQFFVEYQPQVNLVSGKAVGAEILIRWQHPTKGRIPPVAFIPLAESMEMIDYVTQWLIKKAVAQAKTLQEHNTPLPIAINFSPLNFNLRMVQFLTNTLQAYNLPAKYITVEMTENLLLKTDEEVEASLKQLETIGIAVSIDDYGTGYSSLSYLQKMSIDELKLDRSFIHGIEKNTDNYEVVRSTLSMAKNLSLKVVAEGVEDESTQDLLKAMGCHMVQGYGIAKPMSSDALIKWVTKRNS